MFLLLLIACVAAKDDSGALQDTTTFCEGNGTLHTCVWSTYDATEPEPDAQVVITPVPNDPAIHALTGENGCASVDLPAGDYRVFATSQAGDCSSNTVDVSIALCQTGEVVAYLEDRCTGR